MPIPKKGQKTNTPSSVETTPVVVSVEAQQPVRFRRLLNVKALIYLVALLVLVGVAYFFLTGGFNRNNVKIGDTTITKKDVSDYAKQLADYQKAHPGVVFSKDLNQYAGDKLIMNAALKQEAKKYNVAITDDDLGKALGRSFGSPQEAKIYFDNLRASSNATELINLENVAYQSKLQDKLLDRKNLTVVTMILDTPYFHGLPQNQVQSAYDQAKARLNKDFLPLVAKGESESAIAQKADVMYTDNGGASDSEVAKQLYLYFHQGVVAVSNINGYQKGLTGFNDTSSTSWSRGNVGKIYATADKVNQLKKVGDNTGVFASKTGAFMIIRLDSKTGGQYDSWTDFLNVYKDKYAHGKLQLAATSATSTVVGAVNKVVSVITTPGLDQAWADDTSFCGNVKHQYPLTVIAWDMSWGVPIPGVTLYQTRNAGDSLTYTTQDGQVITITPGSSCGLSPRQATSDSNTSQDSTNSYVDNCFDTPPHFSIGPDPAGYSKATNSQSGTNAVWQHAPFPPGGDPSSYSNYGFPDPPNGDGLNHIDPGLANGNEYSVVLEYNPNGPSWTLSPSTSLAPSKVAVGQPATFNYDMFNNGPNTATYTWQVWGSYNGGSYSQSGLPSATVAKQGKSGGAPLHLATSSYTFPGSAAAGTQYCQYLRYNNSTFRNGSGTGFVTTAPNCVTLAINPIQQSCQYVAVASPGSGKQALVWVQDSQGNTLVPSTASNPKTDSPTTSNYQGDGTKPSWKGTNMFVIDSTGGGTWLFNVQGKDVRIVIVIRTGLGSGKYQTDSYSDQTFNCYNATVINPANGACSLSVTGDGPVNPSTGQRVVVAGGTMHVSGTVWNTGPGDLPPNIGGHALELVNGDYNGNGSQWGFARGVGGIVAGGSVPISFDIPVGSPPAGVAANAPWSASLIAHPDYATLFSFGAGSDCGVPVNVYTPFSLTPQAQVKLDPSTEDPTSVNNDTYVTAGNDQVAVKESVTSKIYEITAGGATIPKGNTSNPGPFAAGSTTCLYQSPSPYDVSGCDATLNNGTYPPSTPLNAGDTYCAEIYVPNAVDPADSTNVPYVGPSGDVVGGAPDEVTSCPKIVNEPFFKVYNSSVSAGSEFPPSGGGTCTGGELAGWNNDSGTNPPSGNFGAGAQLDALAALGITGFASAQNLPPTLNGPPARLSFANTGAGVTVDSNIDSPHLGGNFGSTPCLAGQTAPPGSVHPVGSTADIGLLNAFAGTGKHSYSYGTSASPVNLTLTGGNIGVNHDFSIFVNGNVYITSGIKYNGDGTWSVGNIPSFFLEATGNIYIDPGVGELDGVYTAQPDSSGNGGTIYTCGVNNGGGNFTFMAKDNLFSCNRQLTVYGTFMANKVDLMRTMGSLRDETPLAAGTTSVPKTDDPVPLAQYSCAGGDQGNQYKHGHWYEAVNNTSSASNNANGNLAPGATGPPSSTCDNPKLDGYDGYIFPPGDSVFNTKFRDGTYSLLCEYQVSISGTNDHYIYPMAYSSAGDCVSSATGTSNPYPSKGGTVIGYMKNSSVAGTTAFYDNFDGPGSGATCFGTPCSGYHYYSSDSTNGNLEEEGIWGYVFTSAANGSQSYTVDVPVLAQQPNPPTCSNPGAHSSLRPTCAAEVFDFSPELYLSNPAIQPPNNGALRPQSVTGLPPVL